MSPREGNGSIVRCVRRSCEDAEANEETAKMGSEAMTTIVETNLVFMCKSTASVKQLRDQS